jgi:DNA-binding NtrC family response regulator
MRKESNYYGSSEEVRPLSPNSILVVDDERSVAAALEVILSGFGYEVLTTHSVVEATKVLSDRNVDLVITDLRLSDATGIDLITHIKRETPDTEVILMTADGSLEITIEAIKRGAYYYLEKPVTPEFLCAVVDRALQFATLRRENQALKRTLAGDSEAFGMIGHDQQMRRIIETIRTAAPSDASVLIEGESGTGKELIATAFHTASHRAAQPFIRINCAAIPHELIESELFGY